MNDFECKLAAQSFREPPADWREEILRLSANAARATERAESPLRAWLWPSPQAWAGLAAWNGYEKEAKQRGVKLDFADYIPPKIPDAENFASIPIFDAVFRATDE